MRKLVSLVLAFVFAFTIACNTTTQAASPTDSWMNQEAKVSEQVYALLKERAGFAAYIYTDTAISMNPQNLSDFIMEEQTKDYFIGRFYTNSNKILVTKEGLIVSYAPQDVAYTIYPGDLHFKDVQKAVKIFVGPTITETNYINFASLSSNKAISYYEGYRSIEMKIPADARVNAIGYAFYMGNESSKNHYGTIVSGSLQPGVSHVLSGYGTSIDNIHVFNKSSEAMNVFYQSNSHITVQGTENYKTYNLVDKFNVGTGTVIPGDKNPIEIKIAADKDYMKPNEMQTISVIATYSDGSQQIINASDVKWTSSNPLVAKVSNGRIDSLSLGETVIVALYNGENALFTINVQNYKELPTQYNMPVNKKWEVKLNAAVDSKSVMEATIYITDATGKVHPVRYSASGKTVLLTPILNYKSGESYTVWVKNLQSTSGKTIKEHTKMDFTVK